jgi:hypothetical protein
MFGQVKCEFKKSKELFLKYGRLKNMSQKLLVQLNMGK